MISIDSSTAISPSDNSIWIKTSLYDFGWGKENGFYKSPLPNFDLLIQLALYSIDVDDRYGAASVILDKYAEELLFFCENMISNHCESNEFRKLVDLFNLKFAINRCSVYKKTYEQIQNDYIRWKKISEIAYNI